MPRQLQFRAPGHGKLPNNPNNKLAVDPLAFLGDNPWATMTEDILFGAANTMLQIVDDTTGLDLLPAAKMLEDVFGSALSGPGMPDFLTYLGNQPATDPVTGLATPSTNPVGLFTGFLSWVTGGFGILTAGPTMLEQLISAGGGTGNSLSDFGNLFAALGMTAEQIAQDIFGVAGGNLPLLGGNLMSLLGNPNLNVPTGFDPQPIWNSIITDFLNPSGLINAAMDWGALALSMFGISGVTNQAGFTGAASDLLSMLGNPVFGGTGFDPIAAAESMLSSTLVPAGALSSWTPLPPHLFSLLSPGASSGSSLTNMLPDGGFDNPATLDGEGLWFHDATVGRTVTSSVVGSAKTTAGNVLRQLIGVPVTTAPDQLTDFECYVKWSGLATAAGQAIRLCANAYDANDNIISDPGRVLMAISAPTASSVGYAGESAVQPPPPAADVNGWVKLFGPYKAPANTSYVVICVEVTAIVSAGSVWVDDCSQFLHGLIDVMHFGNWGNVQELIPADVVTGFQGINDMLQTLIHTFDGLGSAFNFGTDLTNVNPTQLFGLAQDTANNAQSALSQAVNSLNILQRRTNKPMSMGLAPTSEATFHILSGNTAISSNMTAVAAGTSIMATAFRPFQDAAKGFFEFIAQGNGGANIFVNIFKVDPTTNNKNLVWNSSDIGTLVPNGSLGYVRVPIPSGSQPMMNAGDTFLLEILNAGTGTLSVHTKATGAPNHPSETIKNFGGTRTLSGTGGNSPASLTDAQVTYNGTVPHVNLGVLAVPADYVVPVQYKQTVAGTYTFTLPSWIKAGDIIDLIGIGGGGSGMSEWDAGVMAGGLGGTWNARRLIYGTDIPLGTTTITMVVGAGGPQANGYWQNGNPGTDTVFSYSGGELLRCGHGAGGSGSVGLSNGTGSGPSPKNEVFQGDTYFGGSDVGINAPGSAPGGGGGGATWYEFGGPGAHGEGHINVSRPTS